MKKLAGIALFLAVLYALLLCAGDRAASYENHFNVGQRIGLYGILTLAAGLVIVTGNIDLSMGSVVGLCATVLCLMLMNSEWIFGVNLGEGLDFRFAVSVPDARVRLAIAIPTILTLGVVIGLVNGLPDLSRRAGVRRDAVRHVHLSRPGAVGRQRSEHGAGRRVPGGPSAPAR